MGGVGEPLYPMQAKAACMGHPECMATVQFWTGGDDCGHWDPLWRVRSGEESWGCGETFGERRALTGTGELG